MREWPKLCSDVDPPPAVSNDIGMLGDWAITSRVSSGSGCG
jgi:hypothetical protein